MFCFCTLFKSVVLDRLSLMAFNDSNHGNLIDSDKSDHCIFSSNSEKK